MGYLISETTKEEREQIVADSLALHRVVILHGQKKGNTKIGNI